MGASAVERVILVAVPLQASFVEKKKTKNKAKQNKRETTFWTDKENGDESCLSIWNIN